VILLKGGVGDSPQAHLAKFGNIKNMKVLNLKHPFIL
jgi:hypothetical protein